jgi:hypothetical protein
MPNLRELRVKLRIITGVLGILCALAVGLLIFMYVDVGRQEQQFTSLHSQVQNSRGAMVPPATVEDRVKEAREQISHFYEDRFAASDSSIFQRMGQLAAENHVLLSQASYKTADADLPGLQQVQISAGLSGDYEQVMKFINALERDKMFFIVDGVTLGNQTAGTVHLGLSVETYMRNGEQ